MYALSFAFFIYDVLNIRASSDIRQHVGVCRFAARARLWFQAKKCLESLTLILNSFTSPKLFLVPPVLPKNET